MASWTFVSLWGCRAFILQETQFNYFNYSLARHDRIASVYFCVATRSLWEKKHGFTRLQKLTTADPKTFLWQSVQHIWPPRRTFSAAVWCSHCLTCPRRQQQRGCGATLTSSPIGRRLCPDLHLPLAYRYADASSRTAPPPFVSGRGVLPCYARCLVTSMTV